MRVEPQFSIFLVNKPGVLAAVMGRLAASKVNVLALALSDSGEHGVVRIICDKPDLARQVLEKEHDRWTEAEVVVVDIDDYPGSFLAIAQKLADAQVNIIYVYCTQSPAGGKSTAVFKVSDIPKARAALGG
ncbi:MAG: hypothetical protein HZA50_18440 [Planctomycetes bacterium]|nr:hypothetical protein [Planctomycetota bacterium]